MVDVEKFVYVRAGVKLGKVCIIGSSSTVLSDVPDLAIVVGSPAKVLKFRFEGKDMEENYFQIDFSKGITCDVLVKKSLIDCKIILKTFCDENDINFNSIEILTALIWINMSPLHDHPLDMFLYYFGKYNLHLNLLYK